MPEFFWGTANSQISFNALESSILSAFLKYPVDSRNDFHIKCISLEFPAEDIANWKISLESLQMHRKQISQRISTEIIIMQQIEWRTFDIKTFCPEFWKKLPHSNFLPQKWRIQTFFPKSDAFKFFAPKSDANAEISFSA